MRLNHDCIRDIMLYIEENTSAKRDSVTFNDICVNLSNSYSSDELHYHINQITELKYISTVYADDEPYIISSLKPIGQQYLDNIRDKTI